MQRTQKLPKYWPVIFFFFLLLGIYLNLSYAYFFAYLGSHEVTPPYRQVQTDPSSPIVFNDDPTRTPFAAIGDSLTFGVGVSDPTQSFPALLATSINKKKPLYFYNLGIPGAKTDDLIAVELPKLRRIGPKIIVLLIGINDVINRQTDAKFASNYQTILDQVTVDPQAKVIILNIPALVNPKIVLPPYNYLMDLRIKQFNSIIESEVTAKAQSNPNIILIDLYGQTKLQFEQDPSLYSEDLFHPSAKGYQLWSDLINANINY